MTDVVLVHGAWSDASIWHPVMAGLFPQGHHPTAVGLPTTSLADDVAWTRRELADHEGPVILVGHSYGGSVISAAAVGQAHVVGLVFVCAYAPEPDETVAELAGRGRDMPGGPAMRFAPDGWTSLSVQGFPKALAGDLPPATARILAASQRATHQDCLTTSPGPVAWPDLPCRYVRALDDRMFDPELQSWFADRVGTVPVDLPGSHLLPLSRPLDVAAVVSEMAAG